MVPFEGMSGEMNNCAPPAGAFDKSSIDGAYPPRAHADAYVAWADVIVRSEAMAADSKLARRARMRPGTEMAARAAMTAATISTSTSVKPRWCRTDRPAEDAFCTALRIGTITVPQQTEAGKAGKARTVSEAVCSYDAILRATSNKPGA